MTELNYKREHVRQKKLQIELFYQTLIAVGQFWCPDIIFTVSLSLLAKTAK